MITFTPYIGVSPGTTTVQFDGSWPMPRSYNPGGELSYSMQVPPCTSCQQRRELRANSTYLPQTPAGSVYYDPYVNEARLTGLGASGIRWDLFALALGISFAGVLGFSLMKRKRVA